MKYKNPKYKKIKNSYTMLVSCGPCKADLVLYQKVGKGGLLRLWLDRVIEAEIDLWSMDQLVCPKCGETLGSKLVLKGEEVFKLRRSYTNNKIL